MKSAREPKRERSGDDRGKPSIEPAKHDARVDESGAITDDHEVE